MGCMRQLNINVTPQFERHLRQYMKQKNLARKSDAIREAIREAVERAGRPTEYDFRSWLGMALRAPLNRKRRFDSEDDLWS